MNYNRPSIIEFSTRSAASILRADYRASTWLYILFLASEESSQ